jgi:hypothetical protein
MRKHIATSQDYVTPNGFLAERYRCTCGATSTAAQMAGTPGGRCINALFGHHPCPAIVALHESGESRIEIQLPEAEKLADDDRNGD